MTIVGIVANVRPPFQVGEPYRQHTEANIVLIVRTTPATPTPVAAIKQAIWSVEGAPSAGSRDPPRPLVSNLEAYGRCCRLVRNE